MPTSHRPAVFNLCFHGVGEPRRDQEPGEAEYWITHAVFLRVLDLAVGRDDVRLSFDDGNSSDTEIAMPALIERGLSAEFFLIADRLDRPGSLGAEDARALAEAGMAVGSHGMHHRPWRDTTTAELEEELGAARDLLGTAIQREVTTAACPLGSYDRRVLSELRRHGYTRVMTSDRAVARAGTWLQPRFSVRARDDADSVAAAMARASTLGPRMAARGRVLVKRIR